MIILMRDTGLSYKYDLFIYLFILVTYIIFDLIVAISFLERQPFVIGEGMQA